MKHGKRILGLVGVAVGLIFVVLLSGCGNSTAQQEQQYKQQWTQVMNKFETRVTSDDTKANDLATKNDIVGLRSLINSRLANVNDVLAQVLKLDPPEKYQRVQITTTQDMNAKKAGARCWWPATSVVSPLSRWTQVRQSGPISRHRSAPWR